MELEVPKGVERKILWKRIDGVDCGVYADDEKIIRYVKWRGAILDKKDLVMLARYFFSDLSAEEKKSIELSARRAMVEKIKPFLDMFAQEED